MAAVAVSFAAAGGDLLTGTASLIGVTALIFVAKGHVFGQVLTVVFSLFYAVVSYSFRYYGEMITYLGMTTPIAAMAVISWLRHPFEAGKPEVAVAKLSRRQMVMMWLLTVVVTAFFYWVLCVLDTPNLIVSTVSIITSFAASYLMLFRSPWYAVAYACNDLVLIVLWILAAAHETRYICMVICFCAFFVNDLYGFINWRRMERRQKSIVK